MKNTEKTMEKIVALCKGRGFVFPGSEIYGGLANTWDYGPLGVELKNNVKRAWWKKFVQENPYNVGLDAAILMNPQVWVASGHVSTFNDPLIDCKACKMRHRADKLIESYAQEHGMDRERGGHDPGGAGGLHPGQPRALPRLRQERLHRHPQVQPDVQDPPGRHGGHRQRGVPAAGDRPGHFCQLPRHPAHHPPEAALRRVPDRQVLPQRDHPGQLHLPHPGVRADGAGVLLQARHRSGVVPVLARRTATTG